MTPLLVCEDVTKSFGDDSGRRVVLPGVSLTLQRGEVAALLGASGCGKTTLLNVLAGFLVPDAGVVRLEGCVCMAPGPDRAVVFQEDALFPWLTALENVELGLEAAGVAAAPRRRQALAMLARVGLEGRGDLFPGQLSGGMRQRVALARVLALSPRVLLMDEPFAALDAITRAQMQALLVELHAPTDMGVLLVTHDVTEACLLADVVYVMAPGRGIVFRLEIPFPRPREQDAPSVAALRIRLRDMLRASME